VHGVEAAPGSPAMALVVWTDDVDHACEELAAAGVDVLQPPHNVGNSNRAALLRDPDGNLVEIVAKVHDRSLRARNTSFATVSRVPVTKFDPFRQRMSWTFPRYSPQGSELRHHDKYPEDGHDRQSE
jgi:hypothetical protein